MKNWLLYFFGISLFFSGCQQDSFTDEQVEIVIDDVVMIYELDIQGVVKTPQGNEIENALVTVDGQQTMTDNFGFFSFEKVQSTGTGLYVKAQKDNYSVGGTHYYLNSTESRFLEITLAEFEEEQIVNAEQGGTFLSQKGVSVEFDQENFELNGEPYLGEVKVQSIYLDPNDEDTYDKMPGGLIGVNDTEEVTDLETYGMINVELTTLSGEHLDLTKPVTIKIPVTKENLDLTEMPLWHFDEEAGIWVREGTAQLEGGFYVAEVEHFSWWNCDIPITLVTGCITFLYADGNPIIFTEVTFYHPQLGYATAHTDRYGQVCNKFPKSATISVSLDLDSACTDTEFQFITPNVDFEEQIVISDGPVEITVSGEVTCNGEPVSGYVILNESQYVLIDNGNYTGSIVVCTWTDPIIIKGISNGGSLFNSVALTLEEGQTEYTLNIETCTAGQEVINLHDKVQDVQIVSANGDDIEAKKSNVETTIVYESPNGDYALIGFRGFDSGEYDCNIFTTTISGTEENEYRITVTSYSAEQVEGVIVDKATGGSLFEGSIIAKF